MITENLYNKIIYRKDLSDIPVTTIIKVAIVVIEELLNIAKENSYVEKI